MRAWTTPDQRAWLTARIPQWHRRKQTGCKGFMENLVADFLKAFPDSDLDRSKLRSQIQQWFHFHSKKNDPPPPVVPSVLAAKPRRKHVPLTHAQAYSLLFCKKGTPLHTELKAAWKRYTAGDKVILDKYHHLFPNLHNPHLPFVTFQQVILKDRVTSLTEEELSTIEEFIDANLEEKKDRDEHPWNMLKVDESESEIDLERRYIEAQVAGLSTALENVCDEVRNATNFKPFIMFGGPHPRGTGGIQIFHVGTGETLSEGKTFQEYMGSQWRGLSDKYWSWLNDTYTLPELRRLEGSVNGPGSSHARPVSVAPSLDPTSTPRQSPDPGPSHARPVSVAPSSDPAYSPRQSPDSGATSRDTTEPAEATYLEAPAIATLTPAQTTDSSSAWSPSPRNTPPTQTTLGQPRVSRRLRRALSPPPPTRRAPSSPPPTRRMSSAHPPARHVSSVHPPSSQAQAWPPTHKPSWSLGPQHGDYIHTAAPYLIGVPGGSGWERLLAGFIIFEGLSSSRSGVSRLPVRPRPSELSLWFKMGRRLRSPKTIPPIESIQDFESEWVEWWSAIQPPWRDTRDWPFVRDDATEQEDWGDLPNGGKDGLFLIMVSLGWWIHVRDPSEDLKVDDAIADVTWVVDNLISSLSANAINPGSNSNSESESHVPCPPKQPRKRTQPVKIGFPPRRAKCTHS